MQIQEAQKYTVPDPENSLPTYLDEKYGKKSRFLYDLSKKKFFTDELLTYLLRFQERRLPIFLMLGQADRIRSMLVAVRFRIPGSEFRPGTTIIT
jgi:hypothetical protein